MQAALLNDGSGSLADLGSEVKRELGSAQRSPGLARNEQVRRPR